jgi:hypothetical protein
VKKKRISFLYLIVGILTLTIAVYGFLKLKEDLSISSLRYSDNSLADSGPNLVLNNSFDSGSISPWNTTSKLGSSSFATSLDTVEKKDGVSSAKIEIKTSSSSHQLSLRNFFKKILLYPKAKLMN